MDASDTNIPSPSPRSQTTPSSATAGSSWFSSIVRSRSSNAVAPNSPGPASAAGYSGAVNNKHQFQGVMFKYGPKPIQVAFKIGDFKQQVVFIGGLKEGILATEYLEPLAIALENESWSLVQFLFSSSYHGYGVSNLKQDAMEIDQLISYLIDNEDSHGVILLGHSTGCQDIVFYLRSNAACTRAVRAAILQAPVSDREYFWTLPQTPSMLDLASSIINQGRPSDLMPTQAHPDAPITAYRYHSLCAKNGEDDMFSSDLSEEELKQKLGHMYTTPTLVIFSMEDEHVPRHVNKQELVDRLCKAMGGAEKVEIERGNHSLSNRVEETVEAIMEFVRRDGLKGCDDPWS